MEASTIFAHVVMERMEHVPKAISEKKLKKQVFQEIVTRMNNLKEEHTKALEYEVSPFFICKEKRQSDLLAEYEAELQRQRELFVSVYE